MLTTDLVKEAILKLDSLCESYAKEPLVELASLDKTVTDLSMEVQTMDIASNQVLKKDLNVLQSALSKLYSVLNVQQEALAHKVEEIHLHQQALHAYAMVANNNLGSMA